ncbi:RND transporter [Salinisphaera orenii MK-B5]|uniref:RND transporter n=1 Tax=Salinisphaera orenii MK-B5 TaxID=856730 RepID=A0A423PPT0_9GAMM|nr:efflux RND transporter periplasmic adaptor subunit [Salinisphaera orenii]ROO27593.1 RND transporter [Salinisphaera orenii MK-B5]
MRESRRRSSRLIGIAAVIAVLVGAVAAYAVSSPTTAKAQAQAQAATPPPAVTVAPVIVKSLHEWQEFTGRLQAVESVEVRARVNGYIDRVAFADGAIVHKGDLLFQIDPRPYQAEVDRLSAEKARAASSLALARADFQRGRALQRANAISTQAYDQFRASEAAAKGELGSVEAMLRAARLNLEFTEVRAPIDGRVSRANITAGNLVDGSAVLTTVVSQDPVYAYFDVDEQAFLRYEQLIQHGGDEDITGVFMGLVDETGYPHGGNLDFVDNQVNPDTGTIRARAAFANGDGQYTPGLFARMRLVGGAAVETVLIDDRAIGTDLDKRFVLRLTADNAVEYQRVEMGPSISGLRVVRSGLKPGDVIVVNGLQHVMPGQTVAPERVSMLEDGETLEQLAQVEAAAQPQPLAGADGLPALYIDNARGLVALADRAK